ncbi:nucleoside deaminase [Kineosporia sp. NBRC 101731]|uniref:nucleoside deaminase n=1 Tax=Kineosporia sp. NBRC 101731 TaxID=3032199 RepID=UPI00332F9C07
MSDRATSFSVSLPDWVAGEIRDVPAHLPTAQERMALVHRLADRNHREGSGGPFAALVAERDTGRVLAVGVNVVLLSGLSSVHAEVVALSLAQQVAGNWDLGAAGRPATELVVNWRPCTMCLGATLWSGVGHLVIAGEGPECEQLTGFDEGPVREDWRDQFAARGLTIESDVLRDGAIRTFGEYGSGSPLVYNARQGNR